MDWSRRLPGLRVSVMLLAMVTGLCGSPLGAQTKLVMPEAPLLPGQFAGWTLVAPPAGSTEGATPPMLGTDANLAAIAKEDGASRTATGSYERPGGAGSLKVQAIQFSDATGAVAAYTSLRRREMQERAAETGARNNTNIATSGARTLLREGVSLLVLDAEGGARPASTDLRALGATLPKISGPRGLPPLLPTYLPVPGLVAGTMAYAVGPTTYKASGGALPPELIGFDKAGEAATAEYAGRAGAGKLTLLLLPTPQIAGDRGRAIKGWLNSPEGRAANLGAVKLRRIGPMLALATGGFTADQAKAMVDGIHLRTELTWNKPMPLEFHAEVRKAASLLTSVMVLSGVLGLAAVLLGLFLGFGRAWIRVLMGKPAATEPEFLRLNLRSSPGRSRE